MERPTVLIVPGAFGLPEFYDKVIQAVEAKGAPIRALHIPTVAPESGPPEGPPPTMYDDAACIARAVEKLADEGKDVILLPHSYGGVPATESVKGLSKAQRQSQGKRGGIVTLAYLTCLVPAVGTSAQGVLAEVPKGQQLEFKIDERGWMQHDAIELSAAVCFNDIPKDEGIAWIKRFTKHSSVSFVNELTYAGYKDVPVSYLLCEDDLCIPAKIQREGIELMEKESGRRVDVTILKAGHIPIASKPQEVADWILDVVKKSSGS